jgi:putative transposase
VTICTKNRACLFGVVADGEIQLNDAGRIVKAAWNELHARFPKLVIDEFIVMPNHIHGILIVGAQFTAPSSVLHDDDNGKRGAINRALH